MIVPVFNYHLPIMQRKRRRDATFAIYRGVNFL